MFLLFGEGDAGTPWSGGCRVWGESRGLGGEGEGKGEVEREATYQTHSPTLLHWRHCAFGPAQNCLFVFVYTNQGSTQLALVYMHGGALVWTRGPLWLRLIITCLTQMNRWTDSVWVIGMFVNSFFFFTWHSLWPIKVLSSSAWVLMSSRDTDMSNY